MSKLLFGLASGDGATNNLTADNDVTVSSRNVTVDDAALTDTSIRLLEEIHFLKAIVLIIVVTLLLISSCKIVFKMFSRYAGKPKDDHA